MKFVESMGMKMTKIKQITFILLLIILYAIIKTVDAHALKKSQANANSAPINMLQVERNIEILTDSLNLVNDSNNLDTVLHRYDMAVEALKKLSVFTNQELTGMGFHIHESPSDTLQRMQDKKIQLFNQAIARNLEHDIADMRTIHLCRPKINPF